MSAIVLRLINVAFGRPSVAEAYLGSLAVHVSVAAATCCWWSSPVERMALAGTRQAVRIEAAFATERSQRVDEVIVPLERNAAPVPRLQVESDRAAVAAVSTWRGRPAQQAEMPLASIDLLPVPFRR